MEPELKVFLFAGQSNMAGADSLIETPGGLVQIEADGQTLFTYAPGPGDSRSDHYYPWGDVRGHRARSPANPDGLVHGPEVGFARTLYDAGIRGIAIIKVSANIAPAEERWLWGKGGSFYQAWTGFVDERLAELRARGRRHTVAGLVWHQGIDDALNPRRAPLYAGHLKALIADLRARYGQPDTPFILARSVDSGIAKGMTGSGPGSPMATVRAAQVAVAESDPHAAWIDVDDLPNVQIHHFSAASQLVIGQRFAEAFLRLASRDR
jgi:hypothetical protein